MINVKKLINEKLVKYNMKYAAKDWNEHWYCFEKKPRCVDDMWDVKDGHFMRLFLPPTEEIDWRKSLMQVEVPKKVLTSEVA
jgi:hypothetical protein